MAKTKLHRLHKIKIHDNRWLIWAIAYLLFVAIALIGYLKIATLDFDSTENTFSPTHSYKDERLGFSLRYPATWSIEASNSSVAFLPSEISDEGVSITVTTPNTESSIRRALKNSTETAVTVNNIPAKKLTNDLGNNHTETVVLISYNGKLYVLRGSNNHVEKLLQTLSFVK